MSLLRRRPSAVYTVCDADAALGAESSEWEGAGDPAAEPPTEDLGEIIAMRQPARPERPFTEGERPGAARRGGQRPWWGLALGGDRGAPGERELWASTIRRPQAAHGNGPARAAVLALLAAAAAAISYLAITSLGGRGPGVSGPSPVRRAAPAAAPGSGRGSSSISPAPSSRPPAAPAGSASRRVASPSATAVAPAAGSVRPGHVEAHSRPGRVEAHLPAGRVKPHPRAGHVKADIHTHARENTTRSSLHPSSPPPRRRDGARVSVPTGPVDGRPASPHPAPSLRPSPQPANEQGPEPAERDPAQPAPAGAGSPPSLSEPACAVASCQRARASAEFGFER